MVQNIKILILVFLALVLFPTSCVLMLMQPVYNSDGHARDGHLRASPENLRQHVLTLSSKVPSRSDDTDQLDFSARYISRQLSKFGDAREMPFEVWGIPYKNILVEYGGERNHSNNIIIIGAHYDSFNGLPGADDNASGVAGLIELARMLSESNLSVPVQLVAYALEEPPYFRTSDMGSAVHARQLSSSKVNVILMISLEMIGFFSEQPGSQNYPLQIMSLLYPDKGNYIAIVSNFSQLWQVRQVKGKMKAAMNIPVYSINAPIFVPGIDFSDHMSFWRYDFPAIMVTDTAFYRNKAYHTERDTWEKLDYNKMSEVINGVHAAIVDLSNRE